MAYEKLHKFLAKNRRQRDATKREIGRLKARIANMVPAIREIAENGSSPELRQAARDWLSLSDD